MAPSYFPLVPLVALIAGAWLVVALWATWSGRKMAALASGQTEAKKRMAALVESAPAIPLLVGPDQRAEGDDRLALLLGLERLPDGWPDLVAQAALPPNETEGLIRAVEEASCGGRFSMTIQPSDGRFVRVDGGPAPGVFPEKSVLLWFIDVSETESRAFAVQTRLDRRSTALEALSRLIEAAPFPMWHRGPDLALAMVNGAYVRAVEAEDASDVVRKGIELIDEESLEGRLVVAESGGGSEASPSGAWFRRRSPASGG